MVLYMYYYINLHALNTIINFYININKEYTTYGKFKTGRFIKSYLNGSTENIK